MYTVVKDCDQLDSMFPPTICEGSYPQITNYPCFDGNGGWVRADNYIVNLLGYGSATGTLTLSWSDIVQLGDATCEIGLGNQPGFQERVKSYTDNIDIPAICSLMEDMPPYSCTRNVPMGKVDIISSGNIRLDRQHT